MKVLFAVSNDNVSSSIIKKYQERYKEIITSKNVYYFNAITKELQKDKTYDAIVIGEDLEPISNNNYDTIDKFIFDKLDNISDEAYKPTGEDIPIILICSDRRTKSDELLIKLFGIGVYDALLGNDRNIDMVCSLINKPRSKKEAKNYYRIDSEDVNYKPENESEVSEAEIKNILNHYKKIGNNEKKCVESFDSIANQYNDTQLRIIVKFLPNSVKQILETNSAKYQKLVNGGTVLSNGKYTPYSPVQKGVKKQDTEFLTKDIDKPNLTKPVIIPSTMNIEAIKPTKVERPMPPANMQNVNNSNMVNRTQNINSQQNYNQIQNKNTLQNANTPAQITNIDANNFNSEMQKEQNTEQNNATFNEKVPTVKRRGRPKKIDVQAMPKEPEVQPTEANNIQSNTTEQPNAPKRGRGRPKKVNVVAEDLEQNNIINNVNSDTELSNANVIEQEQNNSSNSSIPAEENSFNLFELGNENNTVKNDNITNQESDNSLQNNNNEPNNPNSELNLFEMANSYDTNVQNANPYDTNVQNVNPYDTNMQNVNSYDTNMQNANSYDTNVQNANSYDANMQNANPYDTNVQNVNPYDTNVQNANSYDTNMQNVNPYDTNMQNVNPYDTNVQNVNPYDTSMQNANQYNTNTGAYNQEQNQDYYNHTNELSRTSKDVNVTPSNFVAQNKIVAFVGTSKNGTSFIVNNLAELLAQKGIKTAILDLTKNKNSYYMFTDNDQNLMSIATQSIKNLSNGVAQGVEVNKNLTVYTSLPDEDDETENFEAILQTLDNNYSAILMDCDFDTNINYFVKATEIYLVQSMDALTIQPLTQFLSELKLKNVLDETKLRVIINKEIKLKILNDKMILGGMAKYNEPSMTLQRDLFNPATIKYVTIPFEIQTYSRYLEAIALCQISLNGYSSNFLASLENLANMVYPLVSGGNYTNYSPNYEKAEKRGLFKSKNKKQPPTQFSSNVNDTLNKMRSNY